MAEIRAQRLKQRGWLSRLLYGLSLIFLLLALFHLAWSVWPIPTDAIQLSIPAGVLPGAPSGEDYASLADYALSISWPRWLRVGDRGVISLRMDQSEKDVDPTKEPSVQVVLAEPVVPNLQIEPFGTVQANLGSGQDLSLQWVAEGKMNGLFPGKVFVSFGFYDETKGAQIAIPVAVVDVDIQVRSLWGLDSGMAIWFGMVGLIVWGALFLLGRKAAGK